MTGDNLLVSSAAILKMADSLKTLAAENDRTSSYIDSHISGDQNPGGEILRYVTDLLTDLQADLKSNYSKLGTLTSDTGNALDNVAKEFQRQDRDRAATISEHADKLSGVN